MQLPDGAVIAQGESPDVVLQRIIESKGKMRKNMLNGYMKALDESEGLQQTIARLADRMGVGKEAPPCRLDIRCHLLTWTPALVMPYPAMSPGAISAIYRTGVCDKTLFSIHECWHCIAFSNSGTQSLQAKSVDHAQ